MSYFVQYDLATGEPVGYGSCAPQDLPAQRRLGVGVIETARDPQRTVEVGGRVLFEVDPEAVRDALLANVDAQAGAAQDRLNSGLPGQARIHAAKEAEARAYKSTSKAGDFPFLTAEAKARGVTPARVRDEILAKRKALVPIEAEIEAKRVAAKAAIREAVTIGAMADAASVEWPAE